MSTMAHGPSETVRESRSWSLPAARELWAAVAIAFIWLAVLCTAIWGGDIVSNDAGGSSDSVPTVVVVAIFAFLGTWVVARHGFRRSRD
jgi:hypothetical protein